MFKYEITRKGNDKDVIKDVLKMCLRLGMIKMERCVKVKDVSLGVSLG